MRWAQVTQVDPVRVQLNGDTEPLPYTLPSVVDAVSLTVGDMVLVDRVDSMYAIVGRSGGEGGGGFVGLHWPGEWVTSPHPSWVLANGAVLNIADHPKLAAHYASVYGTANHHGGNGSTTFAVPDTRERTYVNQGGSDVFATIGAKTGSKDHAHPLSDNAWAQLRVFLGTPQILARLIGGVPSWSADRAVTATGSSSSDVSTNGTPLDGSTDAGSSVQPSFVCRFIIRAA